MTLTQLFSFSKTVQLKKNSTIQDFGVWSTRYKTLARREGFYDVMIGVENEDGDATKKKKNDDGFAHLLLSLAGDKDVMTVAESVTGDLPDRCLKTGWENLNKNYKPKMSRSKNELLKKFYLTKKLGWLG